MEIFLDDQGMLAVPSFARHGDGGLTAIRTLAAEGSFSLLGEPGAGKRTALESIISGIPELDAAEPGPGCRSGGSSWRDRGPGSVPRPGNRSCACPRTCRLFTKA
jgi:hypothetical protein